MLENLGLISYCFSSAKPCMLCLLIKRDPQLATDSSTLQKSHSRNPPVTGGQLLQKRLTEAAGDGGSSEQPLRYWWLILSKLKTRPHKPAVITFLETVHCTPEHYLPRAGGSQRDVLGTLLCLRDWPWSSPPAWKYFEEQNALPIGVNGLCFGCTPPHSIWRLLAGKACCVTSASIKCHDPLKMPIKLISRAALPTGICSLNQENLTERDAEIFHVALGTCYCRMAFAL